MIATHFQRLGLVVALASTVALASCSGFTLSDVTDVFGNPAVCTEYDEEHADALLASGQLLDAVPESTDAYAMALVLNSDAVNNLFQKLSDTSLPELTESTSVLGQNVGVAVQPEIPLLQIGGNSDCPDCFTANIPFDIGLVLGRMDLPRGAGDITVQMPVGMVPEGDEQTALIAAFQDIEITNLNIELGNGVAQNVFNTVEPIITTLLTNYLQTRFADARIATFNSWVIGAGEVLLAGRGPFVNTDAGTVTIAMQSNLITQSPVTVESQQVLPDGADVGISIHPQLLSAMARRMLFEGVIPQTYDESGEASDSGTMKMTLSAIDSNDDGLLQVGSTLWRTGSFCGTADLQAALGFQATSSGVSFALDNVEITNTRGTGQILEAADQLAGGFIDSLVSTLEVTVNYDQVFGGEAEQQSDMETFQANIDGRGVSLFLNVLD